jgi:hypothetical protein
MSPFEGRQVNGNTGSQLASPGCATLMNVLQMRTRRRGRPRQGGERLVRRHTHHFCVITRASLRSFREHMFEGDGSQPLVSMDQPRLAAAVSQP